MKPAAPTTDAIQRYALIYDRALTDMDKSPDGPWVRHEDHLPVQQERDALFDQLALTKSSWEQECAVEQARADALEAERDALKAENARLTDDLARLRKQDPA